MDYDQLDDKMFDLDNLIIVDEDEIEEPTEEEVALYANYLGFDIEKYPKLSFEIAYMALKEPLPENFKKAVLKDNQEIAVYLNLEEGVVCPDSPIDIYAVETYKREVKNEEKIKNKSASKGKNNASKAKSSNARKKGDSKTANKNSTNKKENVFLSDSSEEKINAKSTVGGDTKKNTKKQQNAFDNKNTDYQSKEEKDEEMVEEDSDNDEEKITSKKLPIGLEKEGNEESKEPKGNKKTGGTGDSKPQEKEAEKKKKKGKQPSNDFSAAAPDNSIEENIKKENNSDSEGEEFSSPNTKKKKIANISLKDKSIKGAILSEDEAVAVEAEEVPKQQNSTLVGNLGESKDHTNDKSIKTNHNNNNSIEKQDKEPQLTSTSNTKKKPQHRMEEVFSPTNPNNEVTLVKKPDIIDITKEVEKYKNNIIEIDDKNPKTEEEEAYDYAYDKFDNNMTNENEEANNKFVDKIEEKVDDENEDTSSKVFNISSCADNQTDKYLSKDFMEAKNHEASSNKEVIVDSNINRDLDSPESFQLVANRDNDDYKTNQELGKPLGNNNIEVDFNNRIEGFKYSFKAHDENNLIETFKALGNTCNSSNSTHENKDNQKDNNNNQYVSVIDNSKNLEFNEENSKAPPMTVSHFNVNASNKRKQDIESKKDYLTNKNKELRAIKANFKENYIQLDDQSFNRKYNARQEASRKTQEYRMLKNNEFLNFQNTLKMEKDSKYQVELTFIKHQTEEFLMLDHSEQINKEKLKIEAVNKKISDLGLEKDSLKEEVYLMNRLEKNSKDKKKEKFLGDLSIAREILAEKLVIEKKNLESKFRNFETEVSIEEENKYYRELEELRKLELFNIEKQEMQHSVSLNKILEEYKKAKEDEYNLETQKHLKKTEEDYNEKLKKLCSQYESSYREQEEILKNSEHDLESQYFSSLGLIREEIKFKNTELESAFNSKINTSLQIYEDKKYSLTNKFDDLLQEITMTLAKDAANNNNNRGSSKDVNSSEYRLSQLKEINRYFKLETLPLEEFILKSYETFNINYNIKRNKVKNLDTEMIADMNKTCYLIDVTQELLSYFNEKNIIKAVMNTIENNKLKLYLGHLGGEAQEYENNYIDDPLSKDVFSFDPISQKSVIEQDIKEIARKVANNTRFYNKNILLRYDNLSINNKNISVVNDNINNNIMNCFSKNDEEGRLDNQIMNSDINYLQLNLFSFTLFKEFVKDLFLRRFVYSDNSLFNEIKNMGNTSISNNFYNNNSINNIRLLMQSKPINNNNNNFNKSSSNVNFGSIKINNKSQSNMIRNSVNNNNNENIPYYSESEVRPESTVLFNQTQKMPFMQEANNMEGLNNQTNKNYNNSSNHPENPEINEKEVELRSQKEDNDFNSRIQLKNNDNNNNNSKNINKNNNETGRDPAAEKSQGESTSSNKVKTKLIIENNSSKRQLKSSRPISKISNRYNEERNEEHDDYNSNVNERLINNNNATKLNQQFPNNEFGINSELNNNNNRNIISIEDDDLLDKNQFHNKNLILEFLKSTQSKLEFWKKLLELKINKYESVKNNLFSTSSRLNNNFNIFSKYSVSRPSVILTSSSAINGLLEEDEIAINRNFSDYEKANLMFQEIFHRSVLLFNNTKGLINVIKQGTLDIEIERIKNLKRDLEEFLIENAPATTGFARTNEGIYQSSERTTEKLIKIDQEIQQRVENSNIDFKSKLKSNNLGFLEGSSRSGFTGNYNNNNNYNNSAFVNERFPQFSNTMRTYRYETNLDGIYSNSLRSNLNTNNNNYSGKFNSDLTYYDLYNSKLKHDYSQTNVNLLPSNTDFLSKTNYPKTNYFSSQQGKFSDNPIFQSHLNSSKNNNTLKNNIAIEAIKRKLKDI